MCQVAFDEAGFPRERVIGMAGVLDSARFRTFLAWELGVSVRDVTGFVLGGHGDQMVPVTSYTNVAGIPVSELIARRPAGRDRAAHARRRRRGGQAAEVRLGLLRAVGLGLRDGRLDRARPEARAALRGAAEGEYGLDGIFMGVPCKLGAGGLEEIVEIDAERRRAGAAASSRPRPCASWSA